jgi:hypothetical protein
MGIDPATLSERQWSLIPKEERKRWGKTAMTQAEIRHKYCKLTERKIHDAFTVFCDSHGIDVWHSNPTRKSSIRAGLPDFLCVRDNRCVGIEFKVSPNGLSKVQEDQIANLRAHGNTVHICEEPLPEFGGEIKGVAYSEAVEILKAFFQLP